MGFFWYLDSWKLSKINDFKMYIKQLHIIVTKCNLSMLILKTFFQGHYYHAYYFIKMYISVEVLPLN